MQVNLTAIKFNHQQNSATNDAFSIRRNESLTVPSPEWTPKTSRADDSPAAYARDEIKGVITIQAQFTCDDKTISKIWVQALDANSLSNVLGKVAVTEITLTNGHSGLVPMKLENVRIATAGVSRSEVIWQWQFSLNRNDPGSWTNIITTEGQSTTAHKIYTVLARPWEPWEPFPSQITNIQIPWTDVLDQTSVWAMGAQDVDTAAGQVTETSTP